MAQPALVSSIFDQLLKDRIIWLGSEVRDDNANEICAKILLLAAEDPKRDIYLYINSPGGSITAGMAIYDTMKFVPNDIVTVGIGLAASNIATASSTGLSATIASIAATTSRSAISDAFAHTASTLCCQSSNIPTA